MSVSEFVCTAKIALLVFSALLITNFTRADHFPDTVAIGKKDTSLHLTLHGKQILVTDVFRWEHENKDDSKRGSAGIGDIIIIKVNNLKSLLNRMNCLDSNGNAIGGTCIKQQIRLFLDGRMIKNIAPESGAPQADEGELQFHLERNAENDETWADLLGAPSNGEFFYRPTRVSVGLENEYPVDTNVEKFLLTRVRQQWFWVCIIFSMIYLVALVMMAGRTNLLRDRSIDATMVGVVDNHLRKTFSLARLQMAFWFSLVIASFLFIWLITGDYDIIRPGVLALIGISAGTSLSAIVIDSSKIEDLINKTAALQIEEANLKTELADPQIAPAAIAEKQARLKQIQAEIDKNKKALEQKTSRGFLKDILSDVNGVSFHRVQMFVWTIVLGMIFVYSVWVRLSMPEFSATLLALMGITAGTYLGFKIPEKIS